jgi:hypothetical protein
VSGVDVSAQLIARSADGRWRCASIEADAEIVRAVLGGASAPDAIAEIESAARRPSVVARVSRNDSMTAACLIPQPPRAFMDAFEDEERRRDLTPTAVELVAYSSSKYLIAVLRLHGDAAMVRIECADVVDGDEGAAWARAARALVARMASVAGPAQGSASAVTA